MNIQPKMSGQVTLTPLFHPQPSSPAPAPTPPKDGFEGGVVRERIEGAVLGALYMGGSAALGSHYHGAGVVAATGLSVGSNLAYSLYSPHGSDLPSPIHFLAAGCAVGGAAMGPGFVAAAAGVGACLGYVLSGEA